MRIPRLACDGVVDLMQDDDQVIDPLKGDIGIHSTPAIGRNNYRGRRGATIPAERPPASQRQRICPRIRCPYRKRKWIFHTHPEAGRVRLGYPG
jgi:hypothetical protein